jgi:hypothetical protein
MALIGQRAQEKVVPLKNWATPLYWQPNQGERELAAQAIPRNGGPQLVFSANQVSTDALTFIAITPCRLVDTRGGAFNGIFPFSGPSIAPMTTATFPIQSAAEASANSAPAPCGTIPSIAQAYSFNVTVVPHASGAVNYISIWPAGVTQPVVSTVDDVQGMIVANAAIVPAGTPMGGISVFNYGPSTTDVIIDMNGFFAAPTGASANTAIGLGALTSDTNGYGNTASGFSALENNAIGNYNTASGWIALQNNTTGSGNTASGAAALHNNTAGGNNTAFGEGALDSNIAGSNNTANGADALENNTDGWENTASGAAALFNNTTGNSNIAIGYYAASNVSGTGSYNIHIGSVGTVGDSGVIRIGTPIQQGSTFIAGISGATPGNPNLMVCVDGNGQLGTTGCSTPSSRRFKEQITDMGDSSNKLFQLRPVTFLYKPEYDDGSHALQYGLIAEEVAKLYPDMVGYDKDGQPSSVKYQSLAPMLLNEVQKQNAQIESQAEQIGSLQAQRAEIQTQREQIHLLEDRLAAVEALLTATAVRPASIQ